VESELFMDKTVPSNRIDVITIDGIVSLTGSVDNILAKERAVRIARIVKGVRAVVNETKIDPPVLRTDWEIREDVVDALLFDPRVSAFKVTPEVAYNETAVILRGTVDNLKAKRTAAQDARNTVGVWEVDNRIKVRPAGPLSDEKVEEKIRGAFLRDPYVESSEIMVDVVNGVANLYGTVDSYFEKLQADDVASRINGVILVDNNLVVQGDDGQHLYDPYVDESYPEAWHYKRPRFPAKSDRQIEKDIESELWWSPTVDSEDVTVKVDEGVVTMTGTVDLWSEYNAAANNAYEGGAVYVDNDLSINIASHE
jgi:osmotically-inducible protein OsmY